MSSWYKPKVELTKGVQAYLNDLERVFKVKNARGEWVPYEMQPHQIEWHATDILPQGTRAKNKVVVKSRNTSFTTSSIISILAAVSVYPEIVIPVVRLNQTRANDLIEDFKNIIRNMNVIREDDGSYWPFDPSKVRMDAMSSIKFPNGTEIRAFPATNASAESIRGLRTNIVFIDESNFIKDFNNIYIAARDAASGVVDGEKEFQMLIGTTRKGRSTPFNIWFEDILKKKPTDIQVFTWPVFDPSVVDLQKPLTQQNLRSIVKWHDIQDLENKRLDNHERFCEEYMGLLADSDSVFYKHSTVVECVKDDEKTLTLPDLTGRTGEVFIGVDVATGVGRDYFVLSVFRRSMDGLYDEEYLYYSKDESMPLTKRKTFEVLRHYNNAESPWVCRVDSQGAGQQLAQELTLEFGVEHIESITNKETIKFLNTGTTMPIKAFLHEHHRELIIYKNIRFLNDELLSVHYGAWNTNYTADSNELGHGDITMSHCYATLPKNWKYGGIGYEPRAIAKKTDNGESKHLQNVNNDVQEWISKASIKDRKKFYRR